MWWWGMRFRFSRVRVSSTSVWRWSISRSNAATGSGWFAEIRSQFPQLKLIALSVHEEKNAELAVIEAGANGFVLKRSIGTDLLPTINSVLAGGAT